MVKRRNTKVVALSIDPWVYDEIMADRAKTNSLSSWMQELAIKAHYEQKAKLLKDDHSQERNGEQRHWYPDLDLRTANRFVLEFLEFLPIKGAGEFVT